MAPALLQAATLALRAAASVCPVSPTCPQDNQCSMTTNGVSLQVSCATDYYGGDLQLAQTSTLAGCMSACAATTGCVAASYVGGNCYMKSALNAASENANVIGVAVTSRETTTSTPTNGQQTCPASFSCPENNGCSYTDGSRTLVLSCGADFYGGDYANQYAESLQACTQACAVDTQCAAASFVGGKGAGTCYLKGTKNGASINDNVNGVYVVTASVQSSSTISSSSATGSPSSPTASSIIATSSSIDTLFSTASSTASTTQSSSTFVSSTTSTTSSAIPTPTCDPNNNGVNLVSNPSFEQTNNIPGVSRATTSWTPSSTGVYPFNYKLAAHSGTSYMVVWSNQQYGYTNFAAQKISSALNTSQSYKASFYLYSSQGSAANGCTIAIYANDVRIYSSPVTSFGGTVGTYSSHMSPAFTPSSADVTLKIQFQCSSGFSGVIVDDVSLSTSCA